MPDSALHTPPSAFRVVFFDAGGTLFRPWPSVGEVYARVSRKHGVEIDPQVVEKAFHEKWHLRNGMVSLAQTSEKIERDWWYSFVRDVLHGSAFDDFDAFFEELYDLFAQAECWRLFSDTVPTLEGLKRKGYRMGIISNWDRRLFGIVEQLGLSGFFEHVAASAVVGVPKPGRRIFESAMTAMNVRAEDCLHVGDSVADDYEGARQAGLTPLLIDRSERAYNRVTRMKALTELLERLP